MMTNERGFSNTRASIVTALAIAFLGSAVDVSASSDRGDLRSVTSYALLVGISEHSNPAMNLVTPRNDVTRLAAILVDAAIGGFRPENVTVLTDAEATAAAVRWALQDIAGKAQKDDLILFYFSGHGDLLANGSTYLVTYELEDPARVIPDFVIKAEDIRRDLASSTVESSKLLLVLDACYAGGPRKASGAGSLSPGKSTTEGRGAVAQRFRAMFDAREGTTILYSSRGDEVSREMPGGDPARLSVFAHFLVQAATDVAGSDTSQDGYIDTDELFDYVATRVRDHADSAVHSLGRQTVWREVTGQKFVVFRTGVFALMAERVHEELAQPGERELRDSLLSVLDQVQEGQRLSETEDHVWDAAWKHYVDGRWPKDLFIAIVRDAYGR